MRRIHLLLVVGLAQTMFFDQRTVSNVLKSSEKLMSCAQAGPVTGDHMLGRSYLDPTNVGVDCDNLRIRLPARTPKGGEIYTNDILDYGSYSAARTKLPNAPSSITGFLLYKVPDYESEVDIEVFNDSTRRITFTTYAGGRGTQNVTKSLPFDPTTGFQEYRFVYASGSVTFYADGQQRCTIGTPACRRPRCT